MRRQADLVNGERDRLASQLAAAQSELETLRRGFTTETARAAQLTESRIGGLERTIEDAGRSHDTMLKSLEAMRQQAALVAEERDRLANQLGSAQSAQETLRRRLAAETARTAELTEAKRAYKAEADAAKVKLRLAIASREAVAPAPQESRDRGRVESLRESFAGAQWRMAANQPGGGSQTTSGGGSQTTSGGESPKTQPGGVSQITSGVSVSNLDTASFIAHTSADEPARSASEAELRDTIHRLGLAVAAMTPDAAPSPAHAPVMRPSPVTLRGGLPPVTPASFASE
jgi:hypothetical protein